MNVRKSILKSNSHFQVVPKPFHHFPLVYGETKSPPAAGVSTLAMWGRNVLHSDLLETQRTKSQIPWVTENKGVLEKEAESQVEIRSIWVTFDHRLPQRGSPLSPVCLCQVCTWAHTISLWETARTHERVNPLQGNYLMIKQVPWGS